MPIFKSEGTFVQQNDETYWFKDDVTGQQISASQATHYLQAIVGRKLNAFEFKLLISRPVDGSTNITIISMLASDASQANYLASIHRVVVGYVIRRREKGARFSYGDIIGTDAFYSTDGKPLGQIVVTRKQEPGLQTPLLDPIDFAGGALADLVTAGVKVGARALAGSFRGAMIRVEEKLLARGAADELAKIRVLTEEELAMVWGGGSAKPLTENEVQKAIQLLRNGTDVHVESVGQMHQIQGELGQLGVRSQSSSAIVPQRPAGSIIGSEEVEELKGSYKAGRGIYRVDPAHAPGKIPYSPDNEYTHINITLRDGKKLVVLVTGSKSF